MSDRTIIDVILGEARAGDIDDMRAIASVIVNRALATDATLAEVVSARGQFDAYGKSLPKGVEAYREQALQALAEVLTTGPVHNATFYATPNAVENLPGGLEEVDATDGHIYFTDPQARPIRIGNKWVEPDPSMIPNAYAADETGSIDPFEALLNDAGVKGGVPPLELPADAPTEAFPGAGEGPSAADWALSRPVAPDIPGLSQSAQDLVGGLTSAGYLDPSKITSGARTAAQNASVGGAQGSQHLQGNAVDISTRGMTGFEREGLLGEAVRQGAQGVGVYPGGSVHLDTREGPPAAWGPGGSYRSQPTSSFQSWARGPVAELRGEAPPAGPVSFTDYAGMAPPAGPPEPTDPQGLLAMYPGLANVRNSFPPDPAAAQPAGLTIAPGQPPAEPPGIIASGAGIPPPAEPPAAPPPGPMDLGAMAADGPTPGEASAPQPRPKPPAPDEISASALDVYNGTAQIGRATNGDIISRDPATGQLTRQSQKYGYTENIDAQGNFHGFANTMEGSAAAQMQGMVHGMMPSAGTMGTLAGGAAGGLLGGPLGAAGGAAMGRGLTTGEMPSFGEIAMPALGGVAGGLLGGPAGAALGMTLARAISAPKDGEGSAGGGLQGLLGGLFSALTGRAPRSDSGSRMDSSLTGDGSEGGYQTRLNYSDNGTPLPPSRPPGGGGGWWGGWGGGGSGGGVTRDGSDR